ncbi:T3SS effector OspC family protein [Enterobacter sp. Bisph1]|uniref:T3SS effector OspC family protein n=1 Tax=Enterobacter sp. Bisph1 TaxID=1274399 RepID=UPI00057C156A|nr:T3SS effector OspC family protein [Enterobacter sp. Bisph1]
MDNIDKLFKLEKFLRKALVSQVYGAMFANGQYFRHLGIHLPTANGYSFGAFEHLRKISHVNFQNIREKVGELDDNEYDLLYNISRAHLSFQHRSRTKLSTSTGNDKLNVYKEHPGILSILSNKELIHRNILKKTNTYKEDVKYLHNHDFVFFSCQFDSSGSPPSRYHNGVYFGDFSYCIREDHRMVKYGYMTLTDHHENEVLPTIEVYTLMLFTSFPELKNEVQWRVVCQNNNKKDAPMFDYYLMKPALALYLIDFLRNTRSRDFKAYVYNGDFNSKKLHQVINTVFSPEYHIPRSIYTREYKYNFG